jgi:hypothetical protein
MHTKSEQIQYKGATRNSPFTQSEKISLTVTPFRTANPLSGSGGSSSSDSSSSGSGHSLMHRGCNKRQCVNMRGRTQKAALTGAALGGRTGHWFSGFAQAFQQARKTSRTVGQTIWNA